MENQELAQEHKLPKTGIQKFNSFIRNKNTADYLADILQDKKDQFVTNMVALVSNNKTLQECVPATLLNAALKATAINLPLDQNLGFAYVIPYKNNKENIVEAQFQIGYKGFKQLALRAGILISCTDVRQGELKSRSRLKGTLDIDEEQDEILRLTLPIIGYASYFRYNGMESMFYMTIAEIEQHAKRYSQSYKSTTTWVKNSSLWTTDFDKMAKKTVCKLHLSSDAPLEIQTQIKNSGDQAVFIDKDKFKYIDNTEEINEEEKQKVANMFTPFVEESPVVEQEIK